MVLSLRERYLAEARFPRGTLLGFSMNRGNPLLGILVQMWRKKQTQKGSLKEEATPPEGYVSAPQATGTGRLPPLLRPSTIGSASSLKKPPTPPSRRSEEESSRLSSSRSSR